MVFPNSRTGCSRVPPQSATLTPQYCYLGDPVRLACLIHAASVRSEPESNSQKKKVFSLKVPRGTFVAPLLAHRLAATASLGDTLTQTITVPCLFRRFVFYLNEPSRVTSQASILKDQCPPFRANEDIVYQIFFRRARGYFYFFQTVFFTAVNAHTDYLEEWDFLHSSPRSSSVLPKRPVQNVFLSYPP